VTNYSDTTNGKLFAPSPSVLYSRLVMADKAELNTHWRARHGGTNPPQFHSRGDIILGIMGVAFPNLVPADYHELEVNHGPAYLVDNRRTSEYPREFDDEDGGSNADPDEDKPESGDCNCGCMKDEAESDPNDIEKPEEFEPPAYDVRFMEITGEKDLYSITVVTRGPREYVARHLRLLSNHVRATGYGEWKDLSGKLVSRQIDHKALDGDNAYVRATMAGTCRALTNALNALSDEI
jgi:hypothetical protein